MDIFVSYSSKDEALAQELCGMLARGGYQHWIAADHAAHGKPYASAIIEAIDQAPVMLLVLSQTAADSPHVLNEVNYAFGHGKPILPVVVGQLTLPKELEYYLGAQNLLPYALTEEFEQELLAMVAEAVSNGPREQRPTVVTGAEYAVSADEPEADPAETDEDAAQTDAQPDQEEYPQEPKGALALVLAMWGLAIVALVVMVLLILSPGGKDDDEDKKAKATTTTTTTTTAAPTEETASTAPIVSNPTWGNTTRPSTTATTGKTGSTSKTTGKTNTTATTGSTTTSTTDTTTTTSTETTADTTTSTEAPTESTEAPADSTTSTEVTTEATTEGTEATSNDSAE